METGCLELRAGSLIGVVTRNFVSWSLVISFFIFFFSLVRHSSDLISLCMEFILCSGGLSASMDFVQINQL